MISIGYFRDEDLSTSTLQELETLSTHIESLTDCVPSLMLI